MSVQGEVIAWGVIPFMGMVFRHIDNQAKRKQCCYIDGFPFAVTYFETGRYKMSWIADGLAKFFYKNS